MTFTCDTSVLVPALVSWHESHAAARSALVDVTAVPAHVLLETYSVLTRLPAPQRLSPRIAADAVAALPWPALSLSARNRGALVSELGDHGISGGGVYDALIAATAREHGLTLLSRDRRARRVYEAMGVTSSLL